ncbi:MAG TPA: ATP-binding protein [Gammaproteobacteria bacterium]|nr:ATP-binding protein [Gammaproteobacteria bacterium]
MYRRLQYTIMLQRLREARRFIQVLVGPRQVGKTELARQLMDTLSVPSHYATADSPTLHETSWIEQQWSIGRKLLNEKPSQSALLVLDEIQKIPGWSEVVKRLWDEDKARKTALKVLLLGSSPLLLQHGLSESLAGRFEISYLMHWSYAEMKAAFKCNLEQYIFFGGYPGAVDLIDDPLRFANYINESLVETTLSRDILLLTRVDKPALLRRLFYLACHYSGQIFSFQKMLGQLQDAGNASTLAHYLDLLSGAGMVTGLAKFAGTKIRQKASSPKLQVFNTALMTSQTHYTLAEAQNDPAFWGRLVESAVAAHLINACKGTKIEVFYWRERGQEVDFVLQYGKTLVAIEVKSSLRKESLPGMQTFAQRFKPSYQLLVGEQGMSLEQFFLTPIQALVSIT